MPGSCVNRFGKNSASSIDRAGLDVAVDVGRDVFNPDAATQLLAEKRHVAADDGAEIEKERIVGGLEAAKKLVERLARIGRFRHVRDRQLRSGIRLGPAAGTKHAKEIGQRSCGVGHIRTDAVLGSDPLSLAVLLAALLLAALLLAAVLLLAALLGRLRVGAGHVRLGHRLGAGALHVHAAAEMRTFGDCHARRRDVAVDRAVVANVDFFRPATRPMAVPTAIPTATDTRPTTIEMRAPPMIWLNTSRPRGSVPRR